VLGDFGASAAGPETQSGIQLKFVSWSRRGLCMLRLVSKKARNHDVCCRVLRGSSLQS
jgi:hypothetical protein